MFSEYAWEQLIDWKSKAQKAHFEIWKTEMAKFLDMQNAWCCWIMDKCLFSSIPEVEIVHSGVVVS